MGTQLQIGHKTMIKNCYQLRFTSQTIITIKTKTNHNLKIFYLHKKKKLSNHIILKKNF